jgi:nitrate/TMAO reductase-like tetraheme cytochrome c subunit
MPKISLAGFTDPVRRPRYIIWTGVILLIFAAFMVTVLGVTSTRWFCSEGCHKVQDDTIVAYNHSSHSQISCMACHMPVNANPVVFLLHKMEALGELAMTVTNNYELPLNGESEVSLTMNSGQCTQCHNMANRKVSPSAGLKIDHKVHIDKGISCTICHNRIAHNEDFALQLKDPKTGKANHKHESFVEMTACFRCHGQDEGSPAPGTCSVCHTAGFELKPESHFKPDFFPKAHAELAKEAVEKVGETLKERGDKAVTAERKGEWLKEGANSKEPIGAKLVPVAEVFYCGTCHATKFCNDCHGTQMPHADEFKKPKDVNDPLGHPAISKKIGDKCVMCHTKTDPNFCNKCHHGEELTYTENGKKVSYEFNAGEGWQTQHPKAVAKAGVKECTTCHAENFCADCHSKNRVFPNSHRAGDWTHGSKPTVSVYGSQEASPSAKHALAALESTETCAVCHGAGGTAAQFCQNCHKIAMPHSDQFKKTPGVHRTEGLKNQAVCSNCHSWKELCSNCHHIGASTSAPWTQAHGHQVASSSKTASTCTKCHADKKFCQDCHQKNKVMPGSHKAGNFLKQAPPNLGTHAKMYLDDSSVCANCHTGDPKSLPASSFCMNCHKLAMPHPSGWGLKNESSGPAGGNGGQHADQMKSGKLNTGVCANCHDISYCDSCHHKAGYKAGQSWLKVHPDTVKGNGGAVSCYDNKNGGTTGCHGEAFCSDCHVNRAAALRKGL